MIGLENMIIEAEVVCKKADAHLSPYDSVGFPLEFPEGYNNEKAIIYLKDGSHLIGKNAVIRIHQRRGRHDQKLGNTVYFASLLTSSTHDTPHPAYTPEVFLLLRLPEGTNPKLTIHIKEFIKGYADPGDITGAIYLEHNRGNVHTYSWYAGTTGGLVLEEMDLKGYAERFQCKKMHWGSPRIVILEHEFPAQLFIQAAEELKMKVLWLEHTKRV